VVILAEDGERLTSGAFAARLAEMERRGVPGAAFVVGSDLGLDGSLAAEATARISLSDLTLPHLLARLVLWEQLFRATTILGGGGYHRDVVQ
jgi:23S rRNA (pseudouridine1915-N3)-methyltransferase